MQQAIGASLDNRKRMLEEIPGAGKGVARRGERAKKDKIRNAEGRKERRTWIEHISTWQTYAPRWKKGRRRAKRIRRLQSTNTYARETAV